MYQDKPTLERINKIHPKLRAELLQIYNECNQALTNGVTLRFTYTLRTFAEQKALYDQGRTKPGSRVTNAGPGQSYHNYGLAVDFALLVDKDKNGTFESVSWSIDQDLDKDKKKDWMEVVEIFKKYGWVWGADWDGDGLTKAQGDRDESLVDYPHFQKTFGYNWKQLLVLHNAKKFDKEGFVVI